MQYVFARMDTLAELFNLPLNNLVDTYSDGMRKKLAFLAIKSQNRPVQIYDEPFSGVDLEGNAVLVNLLREMENDKIILLSSHILSTLTEFCNRIYYVTNGFEYKIYLPHDYGKLKDNLKRLVQDKMGNRREK